ncbi:MAG TPA: hypothetical protein VL284_04075 [Thermoanaerobaculia bacterium]|nr:hypothetical protein [Thermoanaerobaculia bacterium]
MAQFLLITTLLSIAGLIATGIAGFLASPGHVAQHIFLALGTVVMGLFSQSMTMFFFIGTGKQMKDKVKGSASEADVKRSTRAMAMRVSPAATYAMAMLMITFIMGGGVSTGKTPRWLHLTEVILTIVLFARAYWVEIQAMQQNADLMDKFL